jgi:hypothetical protein
MSTGSHDDFDLDEYLRGDSALSRQYRSEPAPAPPPALDRRVLGLSKAGNANSPCLAPLAFAASVLLSMALVLAIVFGPQPAKRLDKRSDEAPRLVRVAGATNAPLGRKMQLYSSDPSRERTPSAWLSDIAALRRAGHVREADEEFRRFRNTYPAYPSGAPAVRP